MQREAYSLVRDVTGLVRSAYFGARIRKAASVKAERRSYGATSSVTATIAAFLLSILLVLGAFAPLASAAPEAGPGWAYKGSFGFFFGVAEPPRNPVAVDVHGNIFAAENGNGGVFIYAPTPDGGTEIGSIGGGTPRDLAIDPNTDALYVQDATEFGGSSVRRYLSDGQPTPTYTLDPTFEIPKGDGGIAIDPTSGDLLIADPGAEGVHRYDSSGTLVETIATPSINPSWIVSVPDGSFYVAPAEGPDIAHFSGAGALLGTISGVGSLHGLAYDASDSVVVVAVGEELLAYSPAGALRGKSSAQGGIGIGIAVGASGSLYEHTASSLNYYAPGIVPGAEAPSVSGLAVNSAHESAKVGPGSGPPENSVAHFEVSADGGQSWPEALWTEDVPVERAEGEEPDTVEADLTGLKGNYDYLVRVVVSNVELTTRSGTTPFHTLLGPPEIETGPAFSITQTTAELTGMIDTLGDQTTYHFEYGLTTSYGSEVPAGAEGAAGNERVPRTVSREVSSLQPSTTYHYRLVANNSAGEAVGMDRTFTTSGASASRVYEQVSPRNKMGGSVNPQLGFHPAADGSALAYQVGQAPSDAESAVIFSRALSRRGPTGWLDWTSLDPPMTSYELVTNTVTHAISSDFTHTVVTSNHVLAPGGIEGGGNIYIQDLETGEYTFVGGAPGWISFYNLAYIGKENWFMGGAPDFSWVVLSVPNPMLPGAPERAVYKWSREGGLELESRLPDGNIPLGSVAAQSNYEEEVYRQASDDGSVVYFSLDSWEGGVYRRTGGQTTAISVSHIPGDPATVHGGRFEGASADGRYAFFVSPARLSSDAPTDQLGGSYLYRYDGQDDTLEFVDLVNSFPSGTFVWGVGDDGQVVYYERLGDAGSGTWAWNNGANNEITPTVPGQVEFYPPGGGANFTSPNGRFMAYYELGQRVHLYDAETEESVCVSCGIGDDKGQLAVGTRTVSNRHPEVVNDQGELYFDTVNPLLAEDHNATSDVYQYRDGLLTLISPGDGPYTASFADATPDGSDVFFTTDEGILPGDVDRAIDIYDARVGGGFPEEEAAPECEGEACRPPIGNPPGLESQKGGESADAAPFAISKLRPLSSTERAQLAKGKTARLRLTVSRPGTVKVTGKTVNSSPVKAKQAGPISVPFSLTRAAQANLKGKGRLQIKLSVYFGDANPKVVRFTLNAVTIKKEGRS